jgi:hypothetical protein
MTSEISLARVADPPEPPPLNPEQPESAAAETRISETTAIGVLWEIIVPSIAFLRALCRFSMEPDEHADGHFDRGARHADSKAQHIDDQSVRTRSDRHWGPAWRVSVRRVRRDGRRKRSRTRERSAEIQAIEQANEQSVEQSVASSGEAGAEAQCAQSGSEASGAQARGSSCAETDSESGA